jgi:hypothetical protein
MPREQVTAGDRAVPVDGPAGKEQDGALRPDPSRAGLGLEVKRGDLEQYRVYGGATA